MKKIRFFACLTIFCLGGLFMNANVLCAESKAKIPVILDSDIGDDIDDTWALGFLLKSPELDLKLVVGDQGRAQYRAKLLAKFLEKAGRTDVPVGIGLDVNSQGEGGQAAWVKDYDLKKYPGKVYEDGVQAIIDTIMKSKEKITLLCIGPVPNIKAALEKEPKIAEKANFVGMYGSVHKGYGGSKEISPEWNVKADPKACQKAFTAPWDMTITPLDTCGLINLSGEKYQKLVKSNDPIAKIIIENYRIWQQTNDAKNPDAWQKQSTTLFDTVAVYLTFSGHYLKMEKVKLRVDDAGFTRLDENGKSIEIAAEWKNMAAYEDLLVERLTQPVKK